MNPQSLFGYFDSPEIFAFIMIGIVAVIIYATISAFLKGNSDDKK